MRIDYNDSDPALATLVTIELNGDEADDLTRELQKLDPGIVSTPRLAEVTHYLGLTRANTGKAVS